METAVPQRLGIIAGRGEYPLILAQEARRHGVGRISVLAFRGETRRQIARYADDVVWHWVGALDALLGTLQRLSLSDVVMAGQVKPGHIFTVRLDARMRNLLARLPVRNAETIFGAVVKELESSGVRVLPADTFMERHLAPQGILAGGSLTAEEWHDIQLGWRVGEVVTGMDIGQTVVVKAGIVLAVEAFEGTDAAIRRGGRQCGRRGGAVVVKRSKRTQDMRFDIPVVGKGTLAVLRSVGGRVLAVEAGRTILVGRERVRRLAQRWGIKLVGLRANETGELVEPEAMAGEAS